MGLLLRRHRKARAGGVTTSKAAQPANGGTPEGEPSTDWTRAQLDAYATEHGVDASGAKNKGDVLAAIESAREG